jgi:hypothetical protein
VATGPWRPANTRALGPAEAFGWILPAAPTTTTSLCQVSAKLGGSCGKKSLVGRPSVESADRPLEDALSLMTSPYHHPYAPGMGWA